MAAVVDASSPVRFTGALTNGQNITSASFTAPANSLLVLVIESDGDSGYGTITNTPTSSDGLTWTNQVAIGASELGLDGALSSIWTAIAAASVARTVQIAHAHSTFTSSVLRVSARVFVVTGADIGGTPVDAVTAANKNASTTNNITTTALTPGANGLHFGADCDWSAGNGAAFEAPNDGSTQGTAYYAGQISVADGYKTCASGVASTMNFNAGGTAAAHHKWTQIIVREAAAPSNILRPSSTVSVTGWTVAPSGTAHAALSDESDTSYIQSGAAGARTVEILEGSTVRVTRSIEAGAAAGDINVELTAPEIASFTNWSSLRVRITEGANTIVVGLPPAETPTGAVTLTLRAQAIP